MEQEPLGHVAVQLLEHLDLGRALDSFGNRGHTERVREIDDDLGDDSVIAVVE